MAQAAETPRRHPTEVANGSTVRRRMRAAIRAAAFWSAVVLPVLHLPLLAAGLRTRAEVVVFVALLGLNLLAVYVGHGHRPTGVAVHR
ncbi:MAG: hypothetical protein ACLFMX_04020 [Halobacteriales archaeon]